MVTAIPSSTSAGPSIHRPELQVAGGATRMLIDELRSIDGDYVVGEPVDCLTRDQLVAIERALLADVAGVLAAAQGDGLPAKHRLSVPTPMVAGMNVVLRPLVDAELDQLFVWERDPRAVAMAAFTRADPSDRAAFDGHYQRVRSNPDNTLLAIEDDSGFAGTISSFTMEGEREVSCWIDPSRWGRGIASQALEAFLRIELTRPLFGRVAAHNVGSAKVLGRAGFTHIGSETSYADGVGHDVVEHIFRLAR
jgi:RimJ/RimL family protein N-acetyltransferase